MTSVRAKRREARLGVRHAVAQGGGVLDRLVVLPLDQRPVDRVGQDRHEVRQLRPQGGVREVEALARNRLQARRELETEQPARLAKATSLWPWLLTYWRWISTSVQWRRTPSIIAAAS